MAASNENEAVFVVYKLDGNRQLIIPIDYGLICSVYTGRFVLTKLCMSVR